jgi:hypothetical protein
MINYKPHKFKIDSYPYKTKKLEMNYREFEKFKSMDLYELR